MADFLYHEVVSFWLWQRFIFYVLIDFNNHNLGRPHQRSESRDSKSSQAKYTNASHLGKWFVKKQPRGHVWVHHFILTLLLFIFNQATKQTFLTYPYMHMHTFPLINTLFICCCSVPNWQNLEPTVALSIKQFAHPWFRLCLDLFNSTIEWSLWKCVQNNPKKLYIC